MSVSDLFGRMWPLVPQLRGYLQQRLAPTDADDVIQEVFLRLFQRTRWHVVEFPKRYLYQVAQAVMIDRRRRAVSRCAPLHCELSDGDHPADELSPLRILLAREEICAAEEALKGLPLRTQEIIIAMRLEGASLKSLAARYNISASAVEKHIARALRALSAAQDGEQVAQSSPLEGTSKRTARSPHRNRPRTEGFHPLMDTTKFHPRTVPLEMR